MKSSFQWNTALDVGVESMNVEHKGLLDAMGHIEILMGLGSPKRELLEAFAELISLVREHFRDEEALMAATQYQGLAQHKVLHESLVTRLIEQREEYLSAPTAVLPSAVMDFFRLWLTTHIMIVDKKYGEFIQKPPNKP